MSFGNRLLLNAFDTFWAKICKKHLEGVYSAITQCLTNQPELE